jgi:RalA-binding protein 1
LLERNTLSSQNSQLWNHLKKQRNNYQLAVSDVKRLRGERDGLRVKLAKYEHDGRDEHYDGRRLRTSASAANMSSNAGVDTNYGANSSTISEPSTEMNMKHPTMARHNSE